MSRTPAANMALGHQYTTQHDSQILNALNEAHRSSLQSVHPGSVGHAELYIDILISSLLQECMTHVKSPHLNQRQLRLSQRLAVDVHAARRVNS